MKLRARHGSAHLWDENNKLVVTCNWETSGTTADHERAAELATEIARRVNAHKELMSALGTAVRRIEALEVLVERVVGSRQIHPDVAPIIRAALEKATSK